MNTWEEMPPTDTEIEHWRRRWGECFPATYPPEIKIEKVIERDEGWWIFKQHYCYTVAVCALCGKRISTGHMCDELRQPR